MGLSIKGIRGYFSLEKPRSFSGYILADTSQPRCISVVRTVAGRVA